MSAFRKDLSIIRRVLDTDLRSGIPSVIRCIHDDDGGGSVQFRRASVLPRTLILQYFKHCLPVLAAYYTVFSSWGKETVILALARRARDCLWLLYHLFTFPSLVKRFFFFFAEDCLLAALYYTQIYLLLKKKKLCGIFFFPVWCCYWTESPVLQPRPEDWRSITWCFFRCICVSLHHLFPRVRLFKHYQWSQNVDWSRSNPGKIPFCHHSSAWRSRLCTVVTFVGLLFFLLWMHCQIRW